MEHIKLPVCDVWCVWDKNKFLLKEQIFISDYELLASSSVWTLEKLSVVCLNGYYLTLDS